MHPMLNIAVRAVRKGGNLIARNYESPGSPGAEREENRDLFFRLIQDSKRFMAEVIHKAYPCHTVMAENEKPLLLDDQGQDVHWIIDPLDSVLNFAKRIPHISTSIAVRVKGRTEIAVVYDPLRNELFTAVRGEGAQLNGYRLRINQPKDLSDAILATGLPFKSASHKTTEASKLPLCHLLAACGDFRHMGSVALDLCYVAAGRLDGYFDTHLSSYNTLAGELIVRESGGLVTDFSGNHDPNKSNQFVASNPRILGALLSELRKY